MLFLPRDLVAPTRCGGCGDALVRAVGTARPSAWCSHCRDRWGPVPPLWRDPRSGDAGWAAAVYRGPVRRAVLAAKRGAPSAALELLLGRLPAELQAEWPVGPDGSGGTRVAAVTWVPGHPLRTVTTPDAGRILAEGVGGRLGLPVLPTLTRSPTARRQARRSPEERRGDPHRLGLRAAGRPQGAVLLVDDVRTTGTTLTEASRRLLAAGATTVLALTVAAAPEHPGTPAIRSSV